MENMGRKKKNKKEVKGDDNDQYVGVEKGNGDGAVLSFEDDSLSGDNMEGKKKNKKNKDKGSKKERDACVVVNEGGDAYPGEMEIGGHDVKNGENCAVVEQHVELKKNKKTKKKEKGQRSEKERDEIDIVVPDVKNGKKGEVLQEHVELENNKKKKKKKKKKEKRSENERDEFRSSGHVVENERSDNYLGEIGSGDGQDGENSEVHLEHGDGLKAETKKKKKKEKSANGRKGGENGNDVQGLSTPEESLEVDIIEIFKQKRKLQNGQSNDDLGRAVTPGGVVAEEDINKTTGKKKKKRKKEKTDDDSRIVVVSGQSLDKEVHDEVGRKKRKTGSGKDKKLVKDLVSCEGSSTIEMETKGGEMKTNNKGKGEQ